MKKPPNIANSRERLGLRLPTVSMQRLRYRQAILQAEAPYNVSFNQLVHELIMENYPPTPAELRAEARSKSAA